MLFKSKVPSFSAIKFQFSNR